LQANLKISIVDLRTKELKMAKPSKPVVEKSRKGAYEIHGGNRSVNTGRIAEIKTGRAADGTIIMAPKMKPRDFTVRQIREAVRAVKEEERRKQAAESAS
jgi:hypothetical protein